MIVVTHEMSFAREVADRVVFMDAGVVVEEGPPAQVISNPQHHRTRAFLSRMRQEEAAHAEAIVATYRQRQRPRPSPPDRGRRGGAGRTAAR